MAKHDRRKTFGQQEHRDLPGLAGAHRCADNLSDSCLTFNGLFLDAFCHGLLRPGSTRRRFARLLCVVRCYRTSDSNECQ